MKRLLNYSVSFQYIDHVIFLGYFHQEHIKIVSFQFSAMVRTLNVSTALLQLELGGILILAKTKCVSAVWGYFAFALSEDGQP